MYLATQSHYYPDKNCSINLATNRVGLQGRWTQNRVPGSPTWIPDQIAMDLVSRAGVTLVVNSQMTHPTPQGMPHMEDEGARQRSEDESMVDLSDCSGLAI